MTLTHFHACVVFAMTSFTRSVVCVCLIVQVEEQVKLLQKGVTHIGVGTPGRISALIEKGRCEHLLPTV